MLLKFVISLELLVCGMPRVQSSLLRRGALLIFYNLRYGDTIVAKQTVMRNNKRNINIHRVSLGLHAGPFPTRFHRTIMS